MARLLKKPLIIASAAVILLVIGFFVYIQTPSPGRAAKPRSIWTPT